MKRNASRLLSILLALSLALALLPGTAWAAGSGVRGGVTWTLDDNGHLTLSGTGAINQPDHLDEEWIDQVKTIDIGEGITEIGPVAFELGGCIIKVTLPESLTKIGADAFYLESNLEEINIPAKVTEIGEGAFFGCKKLTSPITLPDGLTTIGSMAFHGVPMTSITVPASVATIEEWGLGYGLTDNWEAEKIPGFTIYGYAGTEAERYAKANGFNFSALGEGASGVTAGVSVTVNGSAVVWTDAEPFIDENNRTMVPLRAVADAMGLAVNWDAGAREASFTSDAYGTDRTITFPVDSTTARISEGGAVPMDTAAIIRDGRTYAPIRYLAEYFGYGVNWDGAAKTVVITG